MCYAGAVCGQYRYEAYWVAEFDRSSCARDVCEARGNVGTVDIQSSLDSTAAQAAVYSTDESGAMKLLGASVVTRAHQSDVVSVSFHWPQDAQSVIVMYVRLKTSNRDAMLVPRQGEKTRKFLLEAPDVCQLCMSNASDIMDVVVSNSQFNVMPTSK